MSQRLLKGAIGAGLALSIGLTGCESGPENYGDVGSPPSTLGDPFFEVEYNYDGQGHAEVKHFSGGQQRRVVQFFCQGEILSSAVVSTAEVDYIYPFPGCDNGVLEPGELEKNYSDPVTTSTPR